MPNRKLANEWLSFAEKSLETAIVLNREDHYTDVIAVDIQQSIEKAFKAIYAYRGEKIPRTHSLDILYNHTRKYITIEEIDIKDIYTISDYYQTERYPGPNYFMPEREEVRNYLHLAQKIIQQIKGFVNG